MTKKNGRIMTIEPSDSGHISQSESYEMIEHCNDFLRKRGIPILTLKEISQSWFKKKN